MSAMTTVCIAEQAVGIDAKLVSNESCGKSGGEEIMGFVQRLYACFMGFFEKHTGKCRKQLTVTQEDIAVGKQLQRRE